jgi:hypothetical protein
MSRSAWRHLLAALLIFQPYAAALSLINEDWDVTFGHPFQINWSGNVDDVTIELYGHSPPSNLTILDTFHGMFWA